jgi:hypothetical protein
MPSQESHRKILFGVVAAVAAAVATPPWLMLLLQLRQLLQEKGQLEGLVVQTSVQKPLWMSLFKSFLSSKTSSVFFVRDLLSTKVLPLLPVWNAS